MRRRESHQNLGAAARVSFERAHRLTPACVAPRATRCRRMRERAIAARDIEGRAIRWLQAVDVCTASSPAIAVREPRDA
eukprot:7179850-Prymnesium_polylepis.1